MAKLLKIVVLAVIAAVTLARVTFAAGPDGAAVVQTPEHASGAQRAVGQPPADFNPLAGFTIPEFENLPPEARPAAKAAIQEEIVAGFREAAIQKAATEANKPAHA